MTVKARVLLYCAYGIILAAVILRQGELLLLAFPMLMMLLIGAIQAPEDIELSASRKVDRLNGRADTTFETRIVVQNRGKGVHCLILKDPVLEGMRVVDGQPWRRLALQMGEQTEIRSALAAVRGVYRWKTITASSTDPLELFEVGCSVPAPARIHVFPEPLDKPPAVLKPWHTLPASGLNPARLAGSGTDFHGVREYRPGDPIRRLNWRLNARHPGKLFSNEFEKQQVGDFGLLLDARRVLRPEDVDTALFEYSIRAAAALAKEILDTGNRVSLLVYSKPLLSVFPGYGKEQLNTVQRTLARARQTRDMRFSTLTYLPTRLFPAHSQIIVFSTLINRGMETYARLIAFGYDVLVVSPDPYTFLQGVDTPDAVQQLSHRAVRIERELMKRRLVNEGIIVIDWDVGKHLDIHVNNAVPGAHHIRRFA